VTILFADLRDFTPWVDATPAREVVRELGAYFTEMEQAIRGEGGLVLQFIGDEIEAAFDAQAARADHAHRAVRARWRCAGAWPPGTFIAPNRGTRARLGEEVSVAGLPPVRVKGRSKEVEVYRVL
jgi:class 3 adenylate cyclase